MTATIIQFPGDRTTTEALEPVIHPDEVINRLLNDLMPRLADLHAADQRQNGHCEL